MRLIDADANIETMKKCAENPENAQALLCYRYAQRILEEAPTVEPASPWHRADEPPEEDGWYMLGFLSRWKNGYWWIPHFPDYWMMPIEPPKEDT